MPRLTLTMHLERHLEAPDGEFSGGTVREVLESAFSRVPALRGYVLDDQGQARKHVAIFVGGHPVRDRAGLTDAVRPDDHVYVLQALSGG